jgi:hypothetical protein
MNNTNIEYCVFVIKENNAKIEMLLDDDNISDVVKEVFKNQKKFNDQALDNLQANKNKL